MRHQHVCSVPDPTQSMITCTGRVDSMEQGTAPRSAVAIACTVRQGRKYGFASAPAAALVWLTLYQHRFTRVTVL